MIKENVAVVAHNAAIDSADAYYNPNRPGYQLAQATMNVGRRGRVRVAFNNGLGRSVRLRYDEDIHYPGLGKSFELYYTPTNGTKIYFGDLGRHVAHVTAIGRQVEGQRMPRRVKKALAQTIPLLSQLTNSAMGI